MTLFWLVLAPFFPFSSLFLLTFPFYDPFRGRVMRDMAQGNELDDEREHEVRLVCPAHDGAPAQNTGAPAPSTIFGAENRRHWCVRTKNKVCPHLCLVRPHQLLVRPHHIRSTFTKRQKTQVRPHLRSGAPAPKHDAPAPPYGAPAPCVPE